MLMDNVYAEWGDWFTDCGGEDELFDTWEVLELTGVIVVSADDDFFVRCLSEDICNTLASKDMLRFAGNCCENYAF